MDVCGGASSRVAGRIRRHKNRACLQEVELLKSLSGARHVVRCHTGRLARSDGAYCIVMELLEVSIRSPSVCYYVKQLQLFGKGRQLHCRGKVSESSITKQAY